MKKRLYVGNLNYQTDEVALSKLFAAVGKVVSVNLVTDHRTDLSLGFAFVEMAKKSAARRAINQLNGKTVDGRDIEVEEAHSRRPRQQGVPLGMRNHRRPPWQR